MTREATTKEQRDADDATVLKSIRQGWHTAVAIAENTVIGVKRVTNALQRLKKAGSIERPAGSFNWKAVA